MSLRQVAVGVAVCVVLVAGAPPAVACKFHTGVPATIADDLDVSNSIAVTGHIENAQKNIDGGTTDFVIGKVLKGHPGLAKKKVVTLDRYIEIPDPKNPPRFVAFGDVRNGGKIELFRGFAETPELVKYVEGMLKIDLDDRVKLLRYAFDFLEPKGTDAASDALALFDRASDADVRKVAEKLDPEVLRKWLRGKDPGHARLRLYGLMLGHCGKPDDAALLRKLLDGPDQQVNDGLLIGYVLLDMKAGYEYLTKLITDAENEFLVKHAGLKALRYFWEDRPGVLTRKQILDGMAALMTAPELADMPIEDLRKWKVWDLTPQVLHLATLESHTQLPINKRAFLKYALTASWHGPKNAAVSEFLKQARKDDPKRVEMIEELLKDEADSLRQRAPMPREK